MSKRACRQPGCPTLIQPGAQGGLCTTHARQADRTRGTRHQRGYGTEHQHIRAAWQQRIDAGEPITCWRCNTPINADTNWHLDHTTDRTGYRGPACPACNLYLAGRARHGLSS